MPGFLDKMKQAAGEMADAAKKGAGQVQTKSHVHQLQGKADDAAKKLGYLIVRERTGGAAAGAEADELLAQIVELQKQIAEAQQASDESDTGAVEGDPASEESGEGPAS
jgi:hypothetical protein